MRLVSEDDKQPFQSSPPGRLDDATALLCKHAPQKLTWKDQESSGEKHTASLVFGPSACFFIALI